MAKDKLTLKTLDFEIEFYEKLLENNPDEISTLIPLGDVYTQRGLYEKGLAIDKRLVNLRPKEPVFYYNLACSFSLLGKKKEAIQAIKRAFELGYRDFEQIKLDGDLDNIRYDNRFRALLKKHKLSSKV